MFGAYFGLAAAYVLGKPTPEDEASESTSMVSDVFSLIGTVFLWLYWPSFVAGTVADGDQERQALLNTVFALAASAVTTFALSPMLEKAKVRRPA
jgi:ammonium transporter Rh